MQVPKHDLIEAAVTKATTLRVKLVEMARAGEYGEHPEEAEAQAQKAEQLFKELRNGMAAARPFGPIEVHPKLKAKIAALRDSGKYPGWTEGYDSLMKTIGEAWQYLPISALQRLRTDVVPTIWRQDSQEVITGFTAGLLKFCMQVVQDDKEHELMEQMGEEARRVSREIEEDLCAYEGFLSSVLSPRTSYQGVLEAIGSGDVTQCDDAIHALRIVKHKLEVEADLGQLDQKPNGQGQPSETLGGVASESAGKDSKTPEPTAKLPENTPFSPGDLAKMHGVPYDALRKRLQVLRKKDPTCCIENQDRKPTEALYLYKLGAALPIIEEMKASSKRSSKRPAQE